MLGNDIIDLRKAGQDSNWRRKGYLEKVFTPAEQLLIRQAADATIMVWLLWSMKEAAYKIYNRQTQIRTYAPLKFICTLRCFEGQTAWGEVAYENHVFLTKAFIAACFIHTVAVTEQRIFDKLKIILDADALQTKNLLKAGGAPYLWNEHTRQACPASLSHHGQFFGMIYMESTV